MGYTKQLDVKEDDVGNGKAKLFDPMAVTWSEKYDRSISEYWEKIPNFFKSCLATIAVFLMGVSINGDWLNITVHIAKQFGYLKNEEVSSNATFERSEISLESFRLQNLQYYILGSFAVSYAMYFGIGGFLHWYFYVRQRDRPEEWKCQPQKFLPPDLERHEILMGSSTLFLLDILTGSIACFISNGGYSTIYYEFNDKYPWWWFFLQIPLIFLYQDYFTYWIHRWYHHPLLYKHFHKLHHKYKQPTAFSVTAIHPMEAMSIQIAYALPIFIFPIHWFPFYVINLYVYYHGIIDHSGVNFKAYWWQPWQPDAIFHDNHHQYFHVNFGFNCSIWDKIHGTYRRKDRVYTEDIYFGQGKPIEEATETEIKADLDERLSENPAAYRDNELEFKLTEEEVEQLKKRGDKKTD